MILKRIVGFMVLLVLGFLVYCLLSGLGMLIALTLLWHSWVSVVLGTLLGVVIVLVCLFEWDNKDE